MAFSRQALYLMALLLTLLAVSVSAHTGEGHPQALPPDQQALAVKFGFNPPIPPNTQPHVDHPVPTPAAPVPVEQKPQPSPVETLAEPEFRPEPTWAPLPVPPPPPPPPAHEHREHRHGGWWERVREHWGGGRRPDQHHQTVAVVTVEASAGPAVPPAQQRKPCGGGFWASVFGGGRHHHHEHGEHGAEGEEHHHGHHHGGYHHHGHRHEEAEEQVEAGSEPQPGQAEGGEPQPHQHRHRHGHGKWRKWFKSLFGGKPHHHNHKYGGHRHEHAGYGAAPAPMPPAAGESSASSEEGFVGTGESVEYDGRRHVPLRYLSNTKTIVIVLCCVLVPHLLLVLLALCRIKRRCCQQNGQSRCRWYRNLSPEEVGTNGHCAAGCATSTVGCCLGGALALVLLPIMCCIRSRKCRLGLGAGLSACAMLAGVSLMIIGTAGSYHFESLYVTGRMPAAHYDETQFEILALAVGMPLFILASWILVGIYACFRRVSAIQQQQRGDEGCDEEIAVGYVPLPSDDSGGSTQAAPQPVVYSEQPQAALPSYHDATGHLIVPAPQQMPLTYVQQAPPVQMVAVAPHHHHQQAPAPIEFQAFDPYSGMRSHSINSSYMPVQQYSVAPSAPQRLAPHPPQGPQANVPLQMALPRPY